MEKHFYRQHYNKANSIHCASIKDLKHLIRNSEVDFKVSEIFPLSELNVNEEINIIGSKNFLDTFELIDCEKLDIVEELKNIEFIGFNDENEIILNFVSNNDNIEDLKAIAIYDFTNKFLDDNFRLKQFSGFAFERGIKYFLNKTIEELIKLFPDQVKQYRFLKIKNEYFLRAITSSRYNNYDNHLVIYLTFMALNKYSKDTSIELSVGNSYITDSEVKLYIYENKSVILGDEIEVKFGYLASNNELTEGTFSLALTYEVANRKNDNFRGLSDFIFNLNHTTNIETVADRLNVLETIHKYKNNVIDYINAIYENELSENQIFNIFKRITDSKQKFNSKTREKAQKIYDEELVNKTLSIIEVLDKLKEITSDVNETIYLQRIYHESILSLSRETNRKENI